MPKGFPVRIVFTVVSLGSLKDIENKGSDGYESIHPP